jgi:hypothetical protein
LSRYFGEQETLPGSFPTWGLTGPSWAQAGFPDWVSHTESTDRNYVSTGCSVVYLYWMNMLGFDDAQLTLAGGATLSANYQKLTGKTTAYQDLRAALTGLAVTSDNPFTPVPAGSWHHNDITAAAGAPAASGIASGYMFPAQGTQHVVYRGIDQHIHELWWASDGWHHNDLSASTGAPAAAGAPDGYMFVAQGTQHVVYRGGDEHIHELWWGSDGWQHNDLTAAAAGGAPLAAGNPNGYMFANQRTQHVVYRGGDQHIHELWWASDGWHHNDLTAAAPGAPTTAGAPNGYMFVAQGTQHVVYRGGDQHIHELWWASDGWHHNDLTGASGGSPVAAGNPSGYMFPAQGTQHVVYPGTDEHIHELWWG